MSTVVLTHRCPRVKAIVSIIAQAKKLAIRTAVTKSFEEIPGPPSWPIIGSLPAFLPGGSIGKKIGIDLFAHFFKTYGPITKTEGILNFPSFVVVFDPEAIAQIHRGENNLPVRPGFESLEYFRKVHNKKTDPDLVVTGSTGLVSEHGEKWKEFRSVVNPIMLQPKTIKLYHTALVEVSRDFMERIKALRDGNNMITSDFDVEINKFSLESIGVVALGGRIGCLDPHLPEDSPARELIKTAHDILRLTEQLDFRPSFWRYFSTPTFKEGMNAYAKQNKLSKHFIKRAVKEIAENKYVSHEKSVLEKLLEVDENTAIIMATDMLMAGVDTASNTLLATMYLLAKNPEKQEKLRKEIQTEVSGPYLKACIKESLRVMPVASGNMRLLSRDYNLCGYHVPKNTRVVFPHQYLSLMEEHYPKAHEYIPERWLVGKDDPLYYGNTHSFVTNPFGFGVRQCIGKQIARLEFESFLTEVLKEFRIRWIGGPPKINVRALNYFVGPFNFVFDDL